jgi:hypothetical protein
MSLFSYIIIQELPEAQRSAGPSLSISEDEHTITDVVSSTLAAKRRCAEPGDYAHKKHRKLAEEPAIISGNSPLTNQLQVVGQDLETEREKVRTLRKRSTDWRQGEELS